ncbi:MAG: SGNH/GDSL hydrolase family protein [Luteolibacter sp.]
MKTPPILIALALQAATLSAAEQIVTLGDSLSFAYEAEFCFQKTVIGIGSIGDNMPATARNWIETLSNPTYRGDRFDLGARDSVTVSAPGNPPFDLYFRQSGNWAIPGLKIHQFRQFLEGTMNFTQIIGSSTDFTTLSTILTYSNFNNATDFALSDLDNQIQNTAERLTITIGGNDIRAAYGTIYNGGGAGTFVADFMADMVSILDHVQAINPNIQIVVTNVPHVGITPLIRISFPFDAVKTERVSAVLRDLNTQLAALARTRNIGFADIYTPTLPMINPANPLCIHGITFANTGSSTGDLAQAWLNGTTSKNFHPNTNGQTVIANEIIRAFNNRYNTGIAPLSATEMLVALSGRAANSIDITYSNWVLAMMGSTPPITDDSDGDGISAGMEFALGLNPTRRDSDYLSSARIGAELELAYPKRLPSSTHYTLTPESSSTLLAPFAPISPLAPAADGLIHARIPIGATPGFLRLQVNITP